MGGFASLFGSFNPMINSVSGVGSSDIQIEQPIISPRPSQQGTFNTSLGNMTPSQLSNVLNNMNIPASSSQQPNSSTGMPSWDNVTSIFKNSPLVQTGSPVGSTDTSLTSTVLTSRLVSAAIGLIFIAGGLFMFKSTRTVVATTAKAAAKLAV